MDWPLGAFRIYPHKWVLTLVKASQFTNRRYCPSSLHTVTAQGTPLGSGVLECAEVNGKLQACVYEPDSKHMQSVTMTIRLANQCAFAAETFLSNGAY
jgi:hypothetical protein